MMLRTTGLRILVGLFVLAGALAGARETWAGGLVITGSGGPVPGTDPYYYYEFDVSLQPGFQWIPNDFFKINSLPGITPLNPSSNKTFLPDPGSASSYTGPFNFNPPVIKLTDESFPFASNVEWRNTTGTTITAESTEVFLGSFFVYTSVPLSDPPSSVSYCALSDDPGIPVFQSGTISLNSVPEPASVALLLSGTGFLALFLLQKRRRRPARLWHPT
jgi:hypothetical protein